jgi:hypothetical protein
MKSRFAGFAVRSFPAQEIPQADAALAAGLAADLGIALPLAAKFGTTRLADQMIALYASKTWPCAEEADFLTYFLRTMSGDDKALLRRALADREQRTCFKTLLEEIAEAAWNPLLEAEAIVALDDPDADVVSNAVRVLAEHGDASVEPQLWKRLEQWSERWRGRTLELGGNPITSAGPREEQRLGYDLFRAIGSASAWPLDEPRRRRLVALCIHDDCREAWGYDHLTGTVALDVSSGGEYYPAAFRVTGFTAPSMDALKRKLQQFPDRTVFRWCPQAGNAFDTFSDGQRSEMFADLSVFLSKLSMQIEPYSEEKCR